jgi:DNA-binding NtrC family response regulator
MTTRILMIDDEPNWIEFIRGNLGPRFVVEVANDLETALAMLDKKSYKLIIASSRRLDLLKSIREQCPAARMVVATAQETTSEAINTFRLGAVDYFPKDFQRESVSNTIRNAIQIPARPST